MSFSPASVPEGFQRARGKPFSASADAYPCPGWGLTRRLRRGLGLAVPRGVHTFLSVAKEKCAKESQRHGDSEGGPPRFGSRASACGSPFGAVLGLGSLRSPAGKSPLLPIFERGSSQCRAQNCWRDNTYVRARSCSLFSSFIKGKAFSLRCLSPLFPPQLA